MSKRYIVPGVRELIPPQGLVTVQLTDPDRPWRVRKEIKTENAIMNWWKSAVDTGFRGTQDNISTQYRSSFNPSAGLVGEAGYAPYPIYASLAIGAYPNQYPGSYGNYMSWFWASDTDLTPDANKAWIPANTGSYSTGDVTAYAAVDAAAVADALFLKRGTAVSTESYSTWDRCRMVCEWNTTQGNGVWRTAGIGNIQNQRTGDGAGKLVALPFQNYMSAHTPRSSLLNSNYGYANGLFATFGGYGYVRSHAWKSDGTELWGYHESTGLVSKLDPLTFSWTTPTFGLAQDVTGVSGIGGIASCNNNAWVVQGTSLYELHPDISGGVTILNTFPLSASISGDTLYDITSDGTDLYIIGSVYVHKVNNLGVWQSSWAHGLTLQTASSSIAEPPSIEYDPAMDHLWVSPGATHGATTSFHLMEWAYQYDSGTDSSWEDETWRCVSFNKTGTQQPFAFRNSFVYGNDTWCPTAGMTGMNPSGNVFLHTSAFNIGGTSYMKPLGPSVASMANLGVDVVKTSSDALKIVYDFDFT